jgi:hypothetical protein
LLRWFGWFHRSILSTAPTPPEHHYLRIDCQRHSIIPKNPPTRAGATVAPGLFIATRRPGLENFEPFWLGAITSDYRLLLSKPGIGYPDSRGHEMFDLGRWPLRFRSFSVAPLRAMLQGSWQRLFLHPWRKVQQINTPIYQWMYQDSRKRSPDGAPEQGSSNPS